MVTRVGGGGSSAGVSPSGSRSRRTSVSADTYVYDRLSPPEEVVWLRIPNFSKIKSLLQNGKLILPKFYRPGTYLNLIV